MRQRIALGGVGMAAVLAFLLLWMGTFAKPLSAMEKMAESIRQAKSYKCTVYTKGSYVPEPGKPPVEEEHTATDYWLAPASSRYDSTGNGPAPDSTCIYPAQNQPWVSIDHREKTFWRHQFPPKRSPIEKLAELSRFSGEADRELGTQEINGKIARGFEINIEKMDPRLVPGRAEIWIDAASNLPIRCRYEFTEGEVGMHFIVRIEDIHWNIDLEPRLFDPTPPAGYSDVTPKPPTLQEQVRQIVEALRIYGEASGGHYPREKIIRHMQTGRELCKLLDVEVWLPSKWPRKEGEDNAGKAAKAIRGFAQIEDIQGYNPDAAYYGKTVGPGDKDKVLLRWKLDDGRYEVIFGDLRAQPVTAERLRALEGN